MNPPEMPKGRQLGERFRRALDFAAYEHRNQKKKGTNTPYVAHLLGVASLVLDAGGDEDLAIAALLHDVAEDCGGRDMLDKVRRNFGERVAQVVEGCTDTFESPKPEWQARKRRYLEELKAADAGTRLVSSADKLYNARSILNDYRALGESLWGRFTGGRDGTLWYYRELKNEFSRTREKLSDELARVVEELDRLAAKAQPESAQDKKRGN